MSKDIMSKGLRVLDVAGDGFVNQVKKTRPSEVSKGKAEKAKGGQTVAAKPLPDRYDSQRTNMYDPKARVTQALFRKATGIGLDPEFRKALSGPMKAAALMFIKNPQLANTMEGAEKMYQLFSNVEGTDEMVS